MITLFPKIKKNFSAYESFRKREKFLKGDKLTLQQEKPKLGQKPRHRCVGEEHIESGLPSGICKIHADISIADQSKYSARIVADFFGENEPCLRFCSWGRHVLNREMGTGLSKRAVATPHFHRVDKHGIMQAYKTKALVKNELLVRDVQSGINLFCQESNVVSPNGTIVMVKLNTDVLPIPIDDPSDNINFYP